MTRATALTERHPTSPGRRDGGITLSALRTFVAVAEAGSVSRAAEAIGVSQPSVSIQLAGLEEACGVLLMRRKPTVALTEAGRDLFVRARLIISRLEEFEDSVNALRGLRRGRLSIGLSAPHWALPLIASFVQAHDGIAITTSLGNTATLLDDIARCRIDVGVMTLLGPEPPFACSRLAAPRLALCVRRDHPLADRAGLRPAELLGERFVMREEGSMTRRVLEAAFAAEGLVVPVAMVLGSREAQKEAVAAGLGVAALFDDEFACDPRLAAVPLVGELPDSGVYAVALRESLEIPAVRALLDHAAGFRPPPPAPTPEPGFRPDAGPGRSRAGSARKAAGSPPGPSRGRR
jgi:LysR family transcriptional regulator, low CO2-responsive transcriptional regulator